MVADINGADSTWASTLLDLLRSGFQVRRFRSALEGKNWTLEWVSVVDQSTLAPLKSLFPLDLQVPLQRDNIHKKSAAFSGSG